MNAEADPPIRFESVVPQFTVPDVARTDGSSPRTSRAAGAYDAYLCVRGLEALAAELRARGADILDGPEIRSYGQRELVVRDCNGLILAFGEEMRALP